MKILCFGDSLTLGYFNNGTEFHPYAIKLRDLSSADVVVEAISGERASAMVERIKTLNVDQFDLVIILGGTNDLYDDEYLHVIYNNLMNLHHHCLNKAVNTIAVSIPEISYEINVPQIREYRRGINDQLKLESSCTAGMQYFDLASAIPSTSTEYWDSDGLHFNSLGYDLFGELLCNFLTVKFN